ncbi:MAG TPA: tRNA lysidine(34) synthetase TilS [Vicinamibacteria bacterium]|nr:tRNA lysidine(34) synthetase TilS [Vicinamibacteria bacterium]
MRLPFLVAAVDRALQASGMPLRGQAIVAGLSGGADSVALLDALSSLRRRRGFRVVAAHLDHGLRPGAADDAAFCASLCERLDVPFRTTRADVRARAARERGGLEQAGRRERYAFLRSVRDEERGVAIAVAHTRDDQAETLLLRLLRGAGATGLGGMRPKAGDVLRPLLGVSRAEVLTHLRERGLAWREDPSNADPAYRRNRVRHELLPYLEERFNPGIRAALARTASILADDAAHLRAEAAALLDRIARAEEGALALERASLARAETAVARAAIRLALHRAGGLARIGAAHVDGVLRLARAKAPSGRRLPLPGGREALFTRAEVRIEKRVLPEAKAVSSRGLP